MILLIDDLRNFRVALAARPHIVARTSEAGLEALRDLDVEEKHIDELWLDHDLGGDDTIMPVVDYLSERAFNERPLSIGRIFVHTQNSVGAKQMLASLTRYGYNAVRVPAGDYLTA